MNQLIIKCSLQLLSLIVFLYSLIMFLRGHNEPGGGFIGGLILSLALILQLIADEETKLRKLIKKAFLPVLANCVLGLVLTMFLPLFVGKNLLEGIWTSVPLPIAGKLSSILAFDFFIYVIVAVTTANAFILYSERQENQL